MYNIYVQYMNILHRDILAAVIRNIALCPKATGTHEEVVHECPWAVSEVNSVWEVMKHQGNSEKDSNNWISGGGNNK